MKRWISLLLSVVLICTTAVSEMGVAYGEEPVGEATSMPEETAVPYATDAGDTGLIVDIGEWEEVETPGPEGSGETAAEAGGEPADETAGKALSELADFTKGYAKVSEERASVYAEAGAESGALAEIG